MKKLIAMLMAGLIMMSAMSVCAFSADTPTEINYTVYDGKVVLSWLNTPDETYTVYWKRSSSSEWKVAGTTSKHKVNITGLKNGVSYDFKVEIGGEDSEIVTATPIEPTYLYAISTVNVRSEPSYTSDRWGSYSCGDQVEVVGEENGWYIINYPYSDSVKYINAAYLSDEVPDGTAEDEPVVDLIDRNDETYVVTSDTEVLSDMVNGEVIGILEAGETVEVTGIVVSDWLTLCAYQISYNDGIAYVNSRISDPDFKTEDYEIYYEDLSDRGSVSHDNRGYVELCVVEDSITSSGATFKIRNSSQYMLDYGEDYMLQVYSDGEWSDVLLIVDSYDVNSIANLVWAGGDVSSFTVDWTSIYGELGSGYYRLVKEYFYETDDGNVFTYGICGFEIK